MHDGDLILKTGDKKCEAECDTGFVTGGGICYDKREWKGEKMRGEGAENCGGVP